MPDLLLNGHTVYYREVGAGVPVVLTPGGRWGGHVHGVLAAELAKSYRVITWDRRNTDGRSDIVIAGERPEAEIWADDLAALIATLDLGPCYVGEYAGCRVTPLLCLRHPELVKGLLLAWPSGGEYAAERLPKSFYRQYIRAALRQGMAAVAEVDRFAGSVAQRRENRDRLLAMEPYAFVRQMAFWEAFFLTSADLPIAGCPAGADAFAAIETPAIVIAGNDPIHPTEVAKNLAAIMPDCRFHDPVMTPDEWNQVFNVLPFPQVSDLQGARIAPVWRAFIRELER